MRQALPGQVKVRKVLLSNVMGNLEGFYMIPKGRQVNESFLHRNLKRLCMLEKGKFLINSAPFQDLSPDTLQPFL